MAEAGVEPPGKALADPPEEAVVLAEPPGGTMAEPPEEAMAEPPGRAEALVESPEEEMAELLGGAESEPPGKTMAEPPGDTMAEAPSSKEGAVTSCSGVVTTGAPSDIFCSGLTGIVGELGAEADTRTVLRVAAGEAGADWPLFCPDFSEP